MKNTICTLQQKTLEKGSQIIQSSKMEAKKFLDDVRGESQNTAAAAGVIFSLLIAGLVIGFGTDFFPDVVFPKFTQVFNALWG